MTKSKTAELALIAAFAGAVGALAACKPQPVAGPANVYAADKADNGVDDLNAVGAEGRPNPDSVDSSTGYSDVNAARRP